ncbi:MAG: YkgJ family cysteine cluster protein [Methanomicrobia archaeon]|nr:YkgJ family cysteine cluster protein [Methanomicrobia archaeon]
MSSGIPCVSHSYSCIQCCLDTNMPLSSSDITRIVKLGYEFGNFVKTLADGAYQLRNSSGRCVFLSEVGCTIYPDRPAGCQLYPLIWDKDCGHAVRDHLCPHADEFAVTKTDITNLKQLIRRLKT